MKACSLLWPISFRKEVAALLEVLQAEKPLLGRITPPGDKSISHRALILGALADGESRVDGLLLGDDVLATKAALEQLGATFYWAGKRLLISGIGEAGLHAPESPLDMGNSGTAIRLLAGVLAAQSFDSELFGDDSLSKRPMGRIFSPLREMGAVISGTKLHTPPIRISGRALQGINYVSPIASAQVKSCVLLAGLFANGRTTVCEPETSRDHTERMLPIFGVQLPQQCSVDGGSRLKAADISVPADISSAAFLIAATLMVKGSDLVLNNVGLNPTRDGFLRALVQMGADITYRQNLTGAEPSGDIHVRYSGRLKAITLPEEWVPSMVDEIPVLMVLAAMAEGTSRIRGAAELRHKESDRLAVMSAGLMRLGIEIQEFEDGIDIKGSDNIIEANLESAGDHRCAMSFAVIALRSPGRLLINDAEYIATSYPGFVEDMRELGVRIQMVDLN
ncbi:MAG: 3-phosphoshikimate 1-carboxyvinyltransferase [Lysobacterales bacterium]|jgi:3-phosphoshikimate 1-carboxyvinyltransferase